MQEAGLLRVNVDLANLPQPTQRVQNACCLCVVVADLTTAGLGFTALSLGLEPSPL